VGRFFFPALPVIPPDLLQKSQQFIEGMKDKHSAVDYECISVSVISISTHQHAPACTSMHQHASARISTHQHASA
jgi:hypothetical protein